jgi:chemotaxis-related protein WspD
VSRLEPLAVQPGEGDCWNHIGVWGDRQCPKLAEVVHCQNCPVFSAAGRRFLDAPSPEGYLEEWTDRLVPAIELPSSDLQSVVILRLGDEWLALPVSILVEITPPRPVHRVPHRGGLLAGIVNIRGELHLCVRLGELLGLESRAGLNAHRHHAERNTDADPDAHAKADPEEARRKGGGRFIVARRGAESWVFPVDQVDQVRRFPLNELRPAPATLARALGRLTRGVFGWQDRQIGLLDEARLFDFVRARIR